MAVAPSSSLVYYAGVANGAIILAEYIAQGHTGMAAIATSCLKNVPPLHSRFSYTTRQRRFICLFDGILTYCAITDEALSKADVFSFLQMTRDAFKTLHKGRGTESESLTLGAHLLDEEIVQLMRRHASLLVGVPEREFKMESDAEVDPENSSPTVVASVDEGLQGYCCLQVGNWLKCLCESSR